MAISVGRPIKKLCLISLVLSMYLLVINISAFLNKMSTPSDMKISNKDSKNRTHGIKWSLHRKELHMDTQESLNTNKYADLNTENLVKDKIEKNFIDMSKKVIENKTQQPEKKDWNDYEAIKAALLRTGPGELGKPAAVEKDQFGKADAGIKESFYNYGINGYLSDQISVNRSVPDHRADICKSTTYLTNLPKVSIIIPFKDECFSTLVRALHSIINRSPPELLEEIILVDDNSKLENLKEKLEKYIEKFFPKVKLVRLLETNGLMRARLIGAKLAKSEILVIFDAHIEVGYNWLPPLIEPIVLNNKTCTLPYIDRIQAETMGYIPMTGFRGGFDWEFFYHHLPLLSRNDETIPHPNPVMVGCAFAIGAKFFWELGGYDNELQIWGGEQYELSFKIWMCGGTLLDIPCSRVAHVAQISHPIRYKGMNNSAVFRNYMRIAEVWMDDYKKYIYQNIPESFKNISAGDISIPKFVRENLQCKSFEWYLKEIAFDSLKHYPYEDPPAYAGGDIRSVGSTELCITMKGNLVLRLLECTSKANINRKKEQTWLFTGKGEIRKKGELQCIEAKPSGLGVFVSECHGLEGRQKWVYNKKKKMLIQEGTNRCLVAVQITTSLSLYDCDKSKDHTQWEFGWYNETMNHSK